MLIRSIFVAVTSSFLVACAGTPVKTHVANWVGPQETYFQGERRTVTVGKEMTSSVPLHRYDAIITRSKAESSTTHKGKPRNLTAEPGYYVLVAEDANGYYYQEVSESFSLNGDVHYKGGFYLSENSNENSALYWGRDLIGGRDSGKSNMYISDLPALPEYSKSELIQLPPGGPSGLEATLVYTGMAGGQVKFVYREYNSGFARPAFTQEISLDYKSEQLYHYKEAQFVVHEANTNSITFTLINPL